MELEQYITATVEQYQFIPLASLGSKANQAFLAMLHYYTDKAGIELPPVVNAVDIGCGNMPYFDGLYTFLRKEGREVHLLGIESGDDYPLNWSPITSQKLPGVKLHWTQNYVDAESLAFLQNRYKLQKFNIVTLFAPGPDPKMMLARTLASESDTPFKSWVDEGKYITDLVGKIEEHLDEQAIVIVTIVDGSVPKRHIQESLIQGGFTIVLDERNIFKEYLDSLGYDHREIMIAQKKK